MEEIIKALSNGTIVGLRTIDDSYDNIYYGKIIKYADNLLDFMSYGENGEIVATIQVKSSDIVSFDTNSADTEYLNKVIANKDKFAIKEEKTIIGSKIREYLHHLWGKEIPALYHTNICKVGYYAYIVGFNENTIILHTFNPYYNIDNGIICFPIETIEKIGVYMPELNMYPYLYENRIKIDKCNIESTDIRLDFLRQSMKEKKLVDVQNATDIKNEEDLVGFVESIQEDRISLKKINPDGKECGLEEYNVKDIVTFGHGGFYLDKIELLYTNKIPRNAIEDVSIIYDSDQLLSLLLDAKENGDILSLISDETEDEYIESTGFLINIINDWIHLKLYDIEENHWYECYRRIQDFCKVRKNGVTELLVKEIYNK
ncbi:MAG: hypothetical protein J5676_05410 [Bacteroidaceae bacterium]|nr:hypothetical protein [Bacteroidaceae bacterium]